MNEIEKLYENAGVERVQHCVLCDNSCPDDCYTGYLFTAEKKLELIKLLTKQCDLVISKFSKWEFIHYDGHEPVQVGGTNFDELLASVVNARWQSLTEEERKQIKEILQ